MLGATSGRGTGECCPHAMGQHWVQRFPCKMEAGEVWPEVHLEDREKSTEDTHWSLAHTCALSVGPVLYAWCFPSQSEGSREAESSIPSDTVLQACGYHVTTSNSGEAGEGFNTVLLVYPGDKKQTDSTLEKWSTNYEIDKKNLKWIVSAQ